MDNFFDYFTRLVKGHIKRYYKSSIDIDALAFNLTKIEDASSAKGIIVIMDSNFVKDNIDLAYRSIQFYKTDLTYFGSGYHLNNNDWTPYPNIKNPLFWVNKVNGMLINWNYFEFSKLLLTHNFDDKFGLDKHMRLDELKMDKRHQHLFSKPIINEISAVIVEYYCKFIAKVNYLDQVKPIEIALSHDIDLIHGNDFFTQAIRLFKSLRDPKKLKYLFMNFAYPDKYHFDNIIKIIKIETENKLSSSFYILNGSIGRFKSRSSFARNKVFYKKLLKSGKVQSNVFGVHYNYDTYMNSSKMKAQIMQIKEFGIPSIIVGRAHYLRFKYPESFIAIENNIIKVDETVGFHSSLGFRTGVAGIYKPFNTDRKDEFNFYESPLFGMDQALVEDYANGFPKLEEMLRHICIIGGRISLLFHHDYYNNPEHDNYYGFYDDLINLICKFNFENKPAHLIEK